MDAYAQGPYSQSYSAIDTGNVDARNLPMSHVFEAVVRFWRDFFHACGKGEALPVGKTALSEP